jgi:hypothetical protein
MGAVDHPKVTTCHNDVVSSLGFASQLHGSSTAFRVLVVSARRSLIHGYRDDDLTHLHPLSPLALRVFFIGNTLGNTVMVYS